jgi:hypothetical protein
MEFGLREIAALASGGAVGALFAWGYHKWVVTPLICESW